MTRGHSGRNYAGLMGAVIGLSVAGIADAAVAAQRSTSLHAPRSAATFGPMIDKLEETPLGPPNVHERPPTGPWIPYPDAAVTSPGMRVSVGEFESVQVNVDDNGNNIVGDAANEPSMAIDPTDPDVIVIGWRQFDNVGSDFRQSGYGYSHDGGQTWTFPGSLWPGRFGSDPVLAADADGGFYYMAIGDDNPGVRLFRSFNGGVNWDGPITVLAPFKDKQWMAIDRTGGMGDGHIYADWTDNSGRVFTRSTNAGLNWMAAIDIPLGNTIWGTLDVGPDGELYVCDRNFTIAKSLDAQNAGVTPTFPLARNVNLGGPLSGFNGGSPNPGGLLSQPWIAVDQSDGPRSGHVYLLCAVDPAGGDPLNVMIARSTDGGNSWGAPVRVNDDLGTAWQWFAAMSVAPSGRIDASWNDTRNTGVARRSELFYAYSTDGGVTWSPNMQAGPSFDSWIGWPQQNKIGDYTHQISDDLGARLIYSATYNNEQDVYFVHLKLDCNGNNLHDGDDIAAGRSRDDNRNWVPDECEGGVNCDLISKFKVKCRRGKLTANVVSTLPPGTRLNIDNDGDRREATINDAGKAKAKWTGQSGAHTVSVVECPDLTREVDCG